MKNIFAHTETTGYCPGYISINEQVTGDINIAVRTRGANNPSFITLTADELVALAIALQTYAPAAAKPKAK